MVSAAWCNVLVSLLQYQETRDHPKRPLLISFLLSGSDENWAHRSVLTGRSTVFARMLSSSHQSSKDVIEIQDTTPEAFQVFMEFMYIGGVCPVLPWQVNPKH
jgi:hypothetical protein